MSAPIKNTFFNYLRLLFKSIWLMTRGRWYVLRDAPLWFVRDIMESYWSSLKNGAITEDHDGIARRLFIEAEKELKRRRFNADREGKIVEFEDEWDEAA